MTNAATARRMHQRRRKRRKRIMDTLLVRGFIALQIVLGGLSGILIGAIIANAIYPGHPIYLAVRDFLKSIFH